MNKHGFTLVELSIVLVIIGLLIGGTLVGQSLIESAQINAQVQQIQQFDAAVMTFKSKYKYLPGDAPSFGGDGDGKISQAGTFIGETGNVWNQLMPAQFSSVTFVAPGQPAVSSGSGKNVPLAKMGKNGSFVVASTVKRFGWFYDNYYVIMDPTQYKQNLTGFYRSQTTTSANSPLKPESMLAFDQKIDNGIANSGYVLSGGHNNECCSGTGPPDFTVALPTCSSTATYIVANDSYECTPLIRVGAQVGQPQ